MPAAACGGDDLTLPGPGQPAALSIVAGDGQRGPLGEPLANPLVVQLVDTEGLPVEGRAVMFRFTDDVPDAAIDPASAPTDADGHAAVRARLGRQAGSQAIEALVAGPGEDLRVRFQLTAVRPDDGDDGPAPRRRHPMTVTAGAGVGAAAVMMMVGAVGHDGGGGHGGGHGGGDGKGPRGQRLGMAESASG